MDLQRLARPLLIDFYAEWCGPCQTMEPVIDSLKEPSEEMFDVLRIDIDKTPELAKQFSIKNVPTFVLLNKEKELWRRVGLMTRRELISNIKKYLKSNSKH